MAERPEDLNLPQSVIGRIMKDAVPEGISVSKEARNAVSKAASVFVLYATSCANNQALQAKRKTLNANDVFQALKDMEFEEFIEPLQKSLEEFRREQKSKKEAQEKRKKSKEAGGGDGEGDYPGDKDPGAEEGDKDEEEDEGIEEEEEEEDGDDGWVEETEEGDDDAQNGVKPDDGDEVEEIMEEDS